MNGLYVFYAFVLVYVHIIKKYRYPKLWSSNTENLTCSFNVE